MEGDIQILHEIRAGRLLKDGITLRADTRKGLLRVCKRDDGLISFQWKERSTSQPDLAPETDIIMFSGDAVFTKIPQSNTRSYMLKFEDTDRDLFFWMQEPKADNDAAHASRISDSINSYQPEAGGEDELMKAASEDDVPGLSAVSNPQAADEQAGIQASQLAQALRSIGMPGGLQPGEADVAQLLAAMQHRREQPSGPSLSQVLKPELLLPTLQDPALLQSLAEHLPEGQRTQQHLERLITSAQFHHQLDVFSSALRSGQLDLAHFGLEGQGSSVLDFLSSIQRQFGKPSGQ